jgi:hypothetical protein
MAIFHTIQEIREKGIGNGFSVLNAADGYRQNNQVWFGECSVCGERVSNSRLVGVWEHKLQLEDGWSKQIDYCPAV